jgi:uncharacterized membrane protein YoaK (UPF0700 family)
MEMTSQHPTGRGPLPIPQGVPTLLAFVAGYVDSCTFLAFSGLFVAQLTGSFVTAGSEFVISNDGFLIKVLAIPTFFAAGMVTTVIVRALGVADWRALVATLALEACLLIGITWVGWLAKSTPAPPPSAAWSHATTVAALFGLAAMGVQSSLARLLLSEYASTNVMTTNTTQLSIDLTDVMLSRRRNRHVTPNSAAGPEATAHTRLGKLAPIMLGFLVGTIVGGLAYASAGMLCLTFAIGIVAALTVWTARCQARAGRPHHVGQVL